MKHLSRFYIAYGSNLSVAQMKSRCPDAVPIGTTSLKDCKLLFKGGATIERAAGCSVPVLIWRISFQDEINLDEYEGYPDTYEKETAIIPEIQLPSGEKLASVEAFYYRKQEHFPLRLPRYKYFRLILDAYQQWGFPVQGLKQALVDSVGEEEAAFFLRANELNRFFEIEPLVH